MRFVPKSWNGMPSWHRYYAVPLAKHYHRLECPVAGETIPVTHQEAQVRKLTPCKHCKPAPI
jgi:hypothetical protein